MNRDIVDSALQLDPKKRMEEKPRQLQQPVTFHTFSFLRESSSSSWNCRAGRTLWIIKPSTCQGDITRNRIVNNTCILYANGYIVLVVNFEWRTQSQNSKRGAIQRMSSILHGHVVISSWFIYRLVVCVSGCRITG